MKCVFRARRAALAGIGLFVLLGVAPLEVVAQDASAARKPELPAYFGVSPWTEGTHQDAVIQSAVSATIPMSGYSITATKDGKTYSGTIVGGSPFASTLTSTTLSAVVVPLKVSIGSATFDPTTADSCNSTPALSAFKNSPLVVATSIGFNGTNITAQYSDGFRQAEFASLDKGTSYSNPILYTTAAAYAISSS